MRSCSWFLFLSLGVACAGLAAEPTKDRAPTKVAEAIDFDGHSLELAFRDKDETDGIQEFIPPGETLENWTRLAGIREQGAADDPSAMAAAMAKNLQAKYPRSPFRVIENKETGEAIIDFVVWPADGSFVEFNVFRFTKNPKGGVISQQYARRAYGVASIPFSRGLKSLRTRLVASMASVGLTRDGTGILGAWGITGAALDGTTATDTATSVDTTSGWKEVAASSGDDAAGGVLESDDPTDTSDDNSDPTVEATNDADPDPDDTGIDPTEKAADDDSDEASDADEGSDDGPDA